MRNGFIFFPLKLRFVKPLREALQTSSLFKVDFDVGLETECEKRVCPRREDTKVTEERLVSVA